MASSSFRITVKGDLKKTKDFLEHMKKRDYLDLLEHYGAEGVNALASVTPVRTGVTANSWGYRVEKHFGGARIVWTNHSLTPTGDSIAILLQYGHGTGTGGYVAGIDYINPAMKPLFDDIIEVICKKVCDS